MRDGRRAWSIGAAAALVLAVHAHAGARPSDVPPDLGYNYGEIETPRIAAMGGALRAYGNSLEGLFLNPANMAATRVYHIGALAQIWPEVSRQTYGAGIVDSVVSSARVAGGLGGTWSSQDPDGVEREWIDLRFALAFPFSDSFYAGVGGRYLRLAEEGLEPLEPSAATGGLDAEPIVNGFALDAGTTLRLGDAFAVSLVGNNLNSPGTGFQPTSVAGGVGFATRELTIEADVLADFTSYEDTTLRAMGGIEYLLSGNYPLRLGYRYDDGQDSHALSGGVGYIDQSLSAELAVRRGIVGDEYTAIFIGFKYHVDSSGLTPSPADTF